MLCDWQFDYSTKLQDHLKDIKPSDIGRLRPDPIGKDRKGNCYWSLGSSDVTARLYRETTATWNEDKLIPGLWQLVCSNITELQQFASSLNKEDKDELQLKNAILEQILPPLLDKQKQKEIAAKRTAKMELGGVSMRNIMQNGRTRRSRKEINYCYEEDFDYISYLR